MRRNLSRELVRSEHDAFAHTLREADRLGAGAPAAAFRAIAAHVKQLRPRLDLIESVAREPFRIRFGRLVGVTFAGLRRFLGARLISTERSYRGTLLELWDGVDTARLLREVAHREGELRLHELCDDLVVEREPLIHEAERALAWFAEHPVAALASRARPRVRQPQGTT